MSFLALQSKTFSRLKEKDGSFVVYNKRTFRPSIDVSDHISDVIEWAHSNVWGSGHLKSDGRDNSTKFKDAVLGKFGEFAFYKHFSNLGYVLSPPDLTVMGYGEWDDGDFMMEGRKISIKSTNFFSDLLMLKKKEWDSNAGYLYGKDGIDNSYKAFFLCRIKPNLEDVLSIKGDQDPGIEHIKGCLEHVNFRMDIPGFITIDDFKKIISSNNYIPVKGKLGAKEMKEELYYCQSGDLREIDEIPRRKK